MEETTQLLSRWRDGDEGALAEVISQHLPFVRERARRLLGKELRAKLTSDDIVQDAVVEFLRYGPRFVPENRRQLQALLARIVASTVCDHGAWFQAARRRMAVEQALASNVLEQAGESVAHPAELAHQEELRDRLRPAMELLTEADRRVLVWRHWDRRSFAAIGQDLGLSEEGARAACRRAIERLRAAMGTLRRDGIDELLDGIAPGRAEDDAADRSD
jgi:RNA polymerase sigma-70 factor, ECF subfamily